MSSSNVTKPSGLGNRLSVWIATGFGLGLMAPAPGTFGTAVWGLPLAWAIHFLPGVGWQILVIGTLILVGIPIATAAGHTLGGEKDNQAIIWDEIATTPIVFLIVRLVNWKVAIAGFLLHRAMDISKPPPARQLERLPEGLGVMADDVIAAIYACLLLGGLNWLANAVGWGFFAAAVGQ